MTPSASTAPSMVYDSADGYVLLLGGLTGAQKDPTWTYANGQWTELRTYPAPPARAWGAMAYDPADHEVVLFGGVLGGYSVLNAVYLGDTWTYHAGHWTELTFNRTSHPSARGYPSFAYDAKDGYLVLFGGTDQSCTYAGCTGTYAFGDTWTFLHGNWSRVRVGSPPRPTPRLDAAMSTNGPSGGVLLFGGTTGLVTNPNFRETWTFAGGTWSNVTNYSSSPPPTEASSLTYDAASYRSVLFGGSLDNGSFANETWTFNGSWHLVPTGLTVPVAPGSGFADLGPTPLVYDPWSSALLLFGVPMWKFGTGHWTELRPHALPPNSDQPLLAFDAKDGYVLLFETSTGTTWKYWSGQWSELLGANSGPFGWSEGSAMVYDGADRYVVLFQPGYANSTWTYVGGAWSHHNSTTAPFVRSNPMIAYDAKDGYVVLFGGAGCPSTGCQEFNDTWKFLAGAWSPLRPTNGTSPPGRHAASMLYDPAAGVVVLFGGVRCAFAAGTCATRNDTWTFVGGTWTNVSSPVAPSTRGGAALAYDASSGDLVLFGGASTRNNSQWYGYDRDTWLFRGGSWSVLHLRQPFTPLPRVDGGLIGVPGSGRVLLFAGSDGVSFRDVWQLDVS